MNRAKRLLNLLQILRGYRYPVTGQRLAERLNISIRTLYRDIATLQSQGAEIEGEVGVGYLLRPGFFLPPLMFSKTEMESLLLGTRWVMQYGDAPLSKAATDALNKILDVLPPSIKNSVNASTLRVGPPASVTLEKEDLTQLREAIANQKMIRVIYQEQPGVEKEYVVWPFTLGYFTDQRILVAWSAQQNDYLQLNTLQISKLIVLNKQYPHSKEYLFRNWRALQLRKLSSAQ